MEEYSWHRELYLNSLRQMAAHAEGKVTTGWLEALRKNYPELAKKYDTALTKIKDLWGKKDPASMEEFKKAVRMEAEATRWAVDKFNEGLIIFEGNIEDLLGDVVRIDINWTEKTKLEAVAHAT